MDQKFVAFKDLEICYFDNEQHSSQCIVFIHGNSSRKEAFVHQFAAPLLKDYRLIALDLPGHGESSKPIQAANDLSIYSYHFYRDVVADFLKELGLENCILVGHSLGGHIAIAVSRLLELNGLVISQTPPLNSMEDAPRAFNADNPALGILYNPDATEDEADQVIRLFARSSNLMKELKTSWNKTAREFRINFMASTLAPGFQGLELDHLKETQTPWKIIECISDPATNHEYLLSDPVLKTHMVEIDGALHYPQYELSELFNKELHRFVKSLS